MLSSSTSSSSPSRSPHRLPPRDNIAAAVVSASSSSPRPLSSRLPPDLDRAGGNRRHTALYLGCARALPHPGARSSSAGGHQDTTLCCHGRVAIVAVAFYAVPCHLNLGAPLSRGATLPAAVLPLMTPRCRHAVKLATTAALSPLSPHRRRRRRRRRRRAAAATAALPPPPLLPPR